MKIPRTPPRVRINGFLTEYERARKEKTAEQLHEWAETSLVLMLKWELNYILGYAEVPKGKKDVRTQFRNEKREEYIRKIAESFYD